MAAAPVLELDTASAVLEFARSQRSAADLAEANLLRAAVDWAAMHSVDSITDAACFEGTEQELPVAGPGAPLVAEFSIHEFATAIGVPTEVGKAYVGEALELRYRLPRLWRRVLSGDLQAWRARRIARSTMLLSPEAAAYVDGHVAHVAHTIGPAALDRLIRAAIARYMPDEAAELAQAGLDRRFLDLHTHQVSGLDGTVEITGRIDVGDACDIEAAISGVAGQLKECGSEASLDVRRSMALGELARRQLTLDFDTTAPIGKQVTLHVHVKDGDPVAHLDSLPLMLDQVKQWCADGQVAIRPVIDLNERIKTDAYTPTDALKTQVCLRDPVCVFPYCSKRSRDGDLDHVIPWHHGGTTSSDNLAPLCRRHHRAKTHGHWSYRVTRPGTYEWTSPHGYQFTKDSSGTTDLGKPGRQRPRP